MSFRNSVNIVVSPRPRIGKTLLARLLTDFHAHEGRTIAAFDVNDGEGTLAQFAPGLAVASSIADTKGQMALFDRLIADDGVTKVVDVGHASFEPFFALAAQIGFIEEAQQRGIAPAILFMSTPDATSVEAFRQLRIRCPSVTLTPVHNDMLGPARLQGKYQASGGAAASVRLPVLASAVRRYIQRPPFSFSDAALAAATQIPPGDQVELRQWLRIAYREFREFDLRILLTDLQASIRLP